MLRRVALLALALASAGGSLAAPAKAQVRPRPIRPAPARAERDTLPRDTTAADSARSARLELTAPDSVMRSLMQRPGYSKTRFEGASVVFDAASQRFQIVAGDAGRALVQRNDSQTVYADSGIYFDQRSKVATASGATIVLHSPSGGLADVVGRGQLTYSLAERSATISNPRFGVQMGETWQISALKGKTILGDSAAGRSPSFYGLGGEITSCTDSVPDYRFKVNEVKRSGANTLVARPAIMYIRDIPVLWLPFLFSDMRPGRHSGILTPRFGVSDIIRSNAGYRRNVDNLGYFWVFNDYMDASAWMDWRSSAGDADAGPGYMRFNGEWRYNWFDRQLNGKLATSYTTQSDQFTNFAVTWNHNQKFTTDRLFDASVNYVTSTRLQRQNTFNPYQAVGTIASSLKYGDRIGPARLQIGGDRTQYPGRDQVVQHIPTLSISTPTLSLAPWLEWTPGFSFNASQTLHMDQPDEFAYRYFANPATGLADSTRRNRNQYTTSMDVRTPIKIFGYDLQNAFSISEQRYDYPKRLSITDPETGANLGDRIFTSFYTTSIDWRPVIQLPQVAQNRFKITPSVSLAPSTSGPFAIRSNLSDGQFVTQTLRPSFGLAAAPTIFGFFPGFGPFSRIRHKLQPQLSYSYAPRASVPLEYLRASGRSRKSEFSGLQQNAFSFGLSQNFEAKVRSAADTTPDGGEKLTLLSINTSSFSYDLDRARAAHSAIRGLTTSTFQYSLSSDLLPGFQFQSSYSLFEGSTVSDTARFKPYRESISASLQLSPGNNPFVVLTRLFGRAVPADRRPDSGVDPTGTARTEDDIAFTRQTAARSVAGSGARGQSYVVPPTRGWSASFSFSSSRSRPVRGGNVVEIDPRERCETLARQTGNPFVLQTCLSQIASGANSGDTLSNTISGATVYRSPAQSSLNSDLRLGITKNWSASWTTSYDFVRKEFAQHSVTLQRDLHDWNANFAFTETATGNFSFQFFISLKAEPDLRFPYNKTSIRRQ